MLNYFLNNQAIDAPLQVDGLTLKKTRNLKYWGFLYRRLGYVTGPTNLRFEDSDTVAVIKEARNRHGIQAETALRLEQDAEVLYDGFLDYATYSDDGTAISIGLRDNRAVLDLSNNAATAYRIEARETIWLHERRLGGTPSLVTDPNTLIIQRSEQSSVPITHAIPLTRRSEKDETIAGTLAPVISPLQSDPCYINTSNKTQLVNLRGVVSVTVSASSPLTASLRAVASDNEANPVLIGTKPITSTPTLVTLAVSVQIEVAAAASLKLEWVGSGTSPKWAFAYDSKTGISLSDEKSFGPSTAACKSVLSTFQNVVSQATGGVLSFRSDWLRNGAGYGLVLTNGAGIRAVSLDLSVSLESLFMGLNSIFNLALWVEGSTVRLEPKAGQPRRLSTLDVILTRVETVATDYVYNAVKAGYTTWQSDTGTLTNDEPNGQRWYSTGITAKKNELNIVSDLITASTVIETQRRKQFDSKLASDTKADSLDNTLFLICALAASDGWKAETGERTQYSTGNYDTATLYNVRLTPGRMVANWSTWIGPSLPLINQTVLGADSLVSTYNDIAVTEKNPLAGQSASRTPSLVIINTPMGMADYANLGEYCQYQYRGQTYGGELLDAEWKLTATGETATLQLLER